MWEGSTKYEYDTRINEWNWPMYLLSQVAFYYLLFLLVMKFSKPPRALKEYQEKKIMPELYLYYFDWVSITHAIIGITLGNTYLLKSVLDPIIIYYSGYRYNQPNHILHMFLMLHSLGYYIVDSILEIYYKTDTMMINIHHVIVIFATVCNARGTTSGFEFVCNKPLITNW